MEAAGAPNAADEESESDDALRDLPAKPAMLTEPDLPDEADLLAEPNLPDAIPKDGEALQELEPRDTSCPLEEGELFEATLGLSERLTISLFLSL